MIAGYIVFVYWDSRYSTYENFLHVAPLMRRSRVNTLCISRHFADFVRRIPASVCAK